MKHFFLIVLSVAFSLDMCAKTIRTVILPDTIRVLKNPLNGWVMYIGRPWTDNFWQEQGYDKMSVGDSTVRVSDYANTCYLRTSWTSLEPEEGKYVWNDSESRISKLFRSIRARGMKLAFRINVDSRDQGQNTPLYVKKAGAKGFLDPNNPQVWSPYPDDSIFQTKFSVFIKALAQEFNDPDKVDFIDAYGLGKWGESHALKYKDYRNKEKVYQWITDVYANNFTKIPLLINYHRMVGDTLSWGEPRERSWKLLEDAIAKGYSLRHDAFGMTGYYQQWEKNFASKWNYKRPIIMEGGWITKAHHSYWKDPSKRYRQGHSEDVRRGEYDDARNGHVNMMDLRINDETRSWFGNCFDLVKRFAIEGGYRLYPSEVISPNRIKQNEQVKLTSVWNNMGWGYCPTNIPQWNQKYKVAYALLKETHGCSTVQKVFVDDASDLSTWLKGKPATSKLVVDITELEKGKYRWAVGLVDVTKNNKPAIEMAVDKTLLSDGWLLLNVVKVN